MTSFPKLPISSSAGPQKSTKSFLIVDLLDINTESKHKKTKTPYEDEETPLTETKRFKSSSLSSTSSSNEIDELDAHSDYLASTNESYVRSRSRESQAWVKHK